MAKLMEKLVPKKSLNPRKRPAFEMWADANPEVRPKAAKETERMVKIGEVLKKEQAATRQRLVKEDFEALPVSIKGFWEFKSYSEHDLAVKENKWKPKSKASTEPVDRQR